MGTIGIIDYGAGNLMSITRAITKVGGKWEIVKSGSLSNYDKLVIPGVGAFIDGMRTLEKNNLVGEIQDFVSLGKPLLGICLGMQLFMDEGTEFGVYRGLGLIKGKTVSLKNFMKMNVPLPHIGWSPLKRGNQEWDSTILSGIPEEVEVYFVHSFISEPSDKSKVVAFTQYGGYNFVSVVQSGNIFGTQFHPEKSGEIGLKIVRNFVEW